MGSYNITCMIFGSLFGNLLVTTIHYPFIGFQIGDTFGLFITVSGCMLNDYVENNDLAQIAFGLENALFLEI
jgi:hypothetical protein